MAIVSAGDDGKVCLWDAASGELLAELNGHSSWVWSCAFSPDGAAIVSAGRDGTLRLWDVVTGEPLLILYQRDGGSASWDPRTNRLLHARGDCWRDLKWIVPGDGVRFDTLPLETFGDLVEEWETMPAALRPVASVTH
jgi:WD40 repeat protein